MQTNLWCQKVDERLPGMDGGGEIRGRDYQGEKQLLGVIDRFIILVGRAGFKCIYMCQNIKLCNLNRFCLSHVDYTSIKLFKKSDTTVV